MDNAEAAAPIIENRTFEKIAVGNRARLSKTVTQRNIGLFAIVSSDVSPTHMASPMAAAEKATVSPAAV